VPVASEVVETATHCRYGVVETENWLITQRIRNLVIERNTISIVVGSGSRRRIRP